ncbi:MAG TPA: FtsX-like permease family protein [Casimicrobiaceae bacterium]|jgi:putative ABC transport system permease protein
MQLLLAARNLTRHRARTAISLSAIAFGVVALVIAGGFIEWIFWAMREAAIQTGLGHVQIARPGFRTEGLADPNRFLIPADADRLREVRAVPGVKTLDQRLSLTGLASSGDITVAFTGEAVDPDAERVISKVLPIVGKNLDASDANGVLLGRGLANALGVGPGDTVTFIARLRNGAINAVEGHVLGTFTTQVKSYDDSAVRMPLDLGRRLLKTQGAHTWVLGLDATEHTDSVVAYLRGLLPVDRFQVASWLDLSDFYRKAVVLLSQQIDVVAVLIGLIIVLGISNTLTMNVLERTGEIGTLMAMGTPRRGVLRLFVTEGVLLGVIGGAIGVCIGVALAELLSYIGIPMPPPPGRQEAYSAQILLTPALVASAFAMALVSATIASLYPAWRASRLPIVDALRHNR